MVAILLAGRWLLGVVLISAGAAKVVEEVTLRVEAVANYQLTPAQLVRTVAVGLPWLEGALGVMLCGGIALRLAGAVAAALLLGFSGAISWNLARGRRFGCGCAGSSARPISWLLAAYDACLGILALTVAFAPSTGLALWPGPGVLISSQSAFALMPVPMLVVLGAITVRVLKSGPLLVGSARRSSRETGV